MGIVSKDGYFYKQLAAEKRMEENRKVSTLTEEQHNALAEICRIRHELHCNHETLFNEEAANCVLYNEYSTINEILTKASLEKISELPDIEDIISTLDYDIDSEGLNLEEWWDKYYPVACEQWEEINRKIENYLAIIDKKHGTNYAPSGATRLF